MNASFFYGFPYRWKPIKFASPRRRPIPPALPIEAGSGGIAQEDAGLAIAIDAGPGEGFGSQEGLGPPHNQFGVEVGGDEIADAHAVRSESMGNVPIVSIQSRWQ